MTGPRARAPPNVPREDLLELWRRERALLGTRISSFDILSRWECDRSAQVASCRRGAVARLMGQPRRDRRGDKTNQTIEDELDRAAIRAARPIEQFRGEEREHADYQHSSRGANALDVAKDVVH